MRLPPLLILGLLIAIPTHAADPLAPQWLNLLRYESVSADGRSAVSEVINPEFFLSPQGPTSPALELEANVREAQAKPDYPCRFPARWQFLVDRGWIEKRATPPGLCAEYEYFRKKLSAESVSIVFAAFYINSVGSAFGHTLFKINGKGEKNALLAHGASYAANLTTNNPIAYAWNGLTGGFSGNYTLLPYYVKIREYNHSEHRDLWEYPLQLSPRQLEMFIAHLWEMDRARFRYYYLTRNCSHQLLKHLDAVEPEFRLASRISTIVMPTQTLRVLQETPGLLGPPKFRASQFTMLEARYRKLSPELRARAALSLEGLSELKRDGLNDREWTELLDFSMDYLDARHARELLFENPDPKVAGVKNRLLVLRSEMPLQDPPTIAAPVPPEAGHRERRWGVGAFQQGDHHGPLLQYRFAFHDLLDRDDGRPRWSSLIMGDLQLQYDLRTREPSIPAFSIARANSNPPAFGLLGGVSWAWDLGLEDPVATVTRELAGFVGAGIGATWVNTENLLLSTMAFGRVRFSPGFVGTSWWSELAPTLTLMTGTRTGKLGVEIQHHWVLSDAYRDHRTVSFLYSLFLTPGTTLRGGYSLLPESNRAELSLALDF